MAKEIFIFKVLDPLVYRFLSWKAGWSRLVARTIQKARKPLPAFSSLEEIERYRLEFFTYRNDPLWGALDYYQHPEHLMVSGRGDCDCQAVWVYLAAQGLAEHQASIITIVSPVVWKNHVFCAIEASNGKLFSIDTRGLHEHLDRADMLAWYERHFKTRYRPYPTPYPFS